MRTIHPFVQGSPEWEAHRATPGMFSASEVASIMGLSKKTTRSELLRLKATGEKKEFSKFVQENVIDQGHTNEALARPIAENIISDDLSAMVMSDTIDGLLFSASLDGITQDYDITFEHKTLNIMLADSLGAGVIPEEYLPQMEVGLMVSGASRCLFMVSKDGDRETARSQLYYPDSVLRKRIIAACKQFQIDLENYQHVEVVERPAAAVTIELPALFVHAKGEITDSNMVAYGNALALRLAEVRAIQLVTDQDFSNAKQSAAMLREQCAKMKLTKEAMLAQTMTIGEAARMMDAWSEDMRVTALKLEKDVEREDKAKKDAIVNEARVAYEAHIKALNARLGGQYMPATRPNFADAIKGKRNYGSMTDAVSTMLANAIVDADMLADLIAANWAALPVDRRHLFPDFAAVCTKQKDDFDALFSTRVTAEDKRLDEAKKAEDARVAAAVEAERIRNEKAVKLDAEALAQSQRDYERTLTEEARPVIAMPKATVVEHSMPRTQVFVDMDRIDDFVGLLPTTPTEKNALRLNLVKWEKYRLACECEVMV